MSQRLLVAPHLLVSGMGCPRGKLLASVRMADGMTLASLSVVCDRSYPTKRPRQNRGLWFSGKANDQRE